MRQESLLLMFVVVWASISNIYEDIPIGLYDPEVWRTTPETNLKIYDKYIVTSYRSSDEFAKETFTFRDLVSRSTITKKSGTKIRVLRVKAVSDAMEKDLHEIIIELHPNNVGIIKITDLVEDVASIYIGKVY